MSSEHKNSKWISSCTNCTMYTKVSDACHSMIQLKIRNDFARNILTKNCGSGEFVHAGCLTVWQQPASKPVWNALRCIFMKKLSLYEKLSVLVPWRWNLGMKHRIGLPKRHSNRNSVPSSVPRSQNFKWRRYCSPFAACDATNLWRTLSTNLKALNLDFG